MSLTQNLPMASKTVRRQLKAILFSCHAPPVLDHVVRALEVNGYSIMLMVTARGPNHALPTSAYDSLGKQITDVCDSYSFPILVVKNISHAKSTITKIDADLGLCMGFPYKITQDLINSRTTYVNLHPAPLPYLRGPLPYIWPVLEPDMYPISGYCSTAHYVGEADDSGNLIKETPIQIPECLSESFNAEDVHRASLQAMCCMMQEVAKLVREGYPGYKQKTLPPAYAENAARSLTDDERTISHDMTVDQAMRIFRASFDTMPFFRHQQALYQVAKLRPLERCPRKHEMEKMKQPPDYAFRKDTHVLQSFADGQLLMDLRKL